jgi:hypothetical protein
MLDPRRVVRRLAKPSRRARSSADSSLYLGERARHREPKEERDQSQHGQVVDPDTDPAGNPPATQRLHPRTHRCGDDHREEEERDYQPKLPKRERADDHRDGDNRGDQRSTSGRAGSAIPRILIVRRPIWPTALLPASRCISRRCHVQIESSLSGRVW